MASTAPRGEPTEADREAIRRLLPFAVGLGIGGGGNNPSPPGPLSEHQRDDAREPTTKGKSGKAKRNGAKGPRKSDPPVSSGGGLPGASGTDRVKYSREMMMSLKSSPLARLPPGADVSMLAGPSGKGSGARGGRNSNKDEAETGRGLQFANAPGTALGKGRGGRASAGRSSAAFVPFGDATLGAKPPPALSAPHVKLSERVDALRTNPGSRSPPTNPRMDRTDPREARGGQRDPNWGRNNAPPQQRGRSTGGRQQQRQEKEPMPEWATETFDRDDMLILGGFDDIDDSNLPDFFKKTPATTSAGGALEGGLEDSLEPCPSKQPPTVDEDTFFGESARSENGGGADAHSSKFSRFFAADEDEPSESNIPQTPWSTDPVETEIPAPLEQNRRQGAPSSQPPPRHETPASKDATSVAPGAGPSAVEEDRVSLRRLFGISAGGTEASAHPPPDVGMSGNVAQPPPPSTIPSGEGRTSHNLEEDRSNMMKFFGGAFQGPPGLAPIPQQRQASSAGGKSAPAAGPFVEDGEDDTMGEMIMPASGSHQPASGSHQPAPPSQTNEEFRETLFAMLGKSNPPTTAHANAGTEAPSAAGSSITMAQPPHESTPAPADESTVKVSRAFMPTSVIRKMGNKGGRGRARGRGGRQNSGTSSQHRHTDAASAKAAAQAQSAAQQNILRLFGSDFK